MLLCYVGMVLKFFAFFFFIREKANWSGKARWERNSFLLFGMRKSKKVSC